MSLHRMQPLPLSRVALKGGFWGPRVETVRRSTVPHQLNQLEETGHLDALRLKWKPGSQRKPHIFWDSDLAKWLEAACFCLTTRSSRKLKKEVERVVELIVRAQRSDGYLNSYFSSVEPSKRWENLKDRHELYCAGHLMEAAAAHFEATGESALVTAMSRFADHIGSILGPGKNQIQGYPGHEEIELALVKLFRCTGEKRYLNLARYFIDERGKSPHFFEAEAEARGDDPDRARPPQTPHFSRQGSAYDQWQAHVPPRQQKAAEGHAVRALYLYSGMADVAAETEDTELLAACRRLWRNIVHRRMYITGGVGSHRFGERFSFDYDLPNEEAYAETCAAIAMVFFASRMLQIDADAEYADIMERALYNGVLSGISPDGKRYFYTNPLAVNPVAARMPQVRADRRRQPWFICACCPTNIARLLASLGGYVYSTARNEIFVHLYAQGVLSTELEGKKVRIEQKTNYPWEESIVISVYTEEPLSFTLSLRLPGWCRKPSLKISGRRFGLTDSVRKGYVRMKREWRSGDKIELILPMPPERFEAHPSVRQNCGRIALQRGPVIYCFEETDNGKNLADLIIAADGKIAAEYSQEFPGGGAVVLSGTAFRRDPADWKDRLYRRASTNMIKVPFRAVPYALWNNRKPGEMRVWMRQAPDQNQTMFFV